MTQAQYQRIAELISRIRNAKFGEMVEHLEQLIDSGDWRDFTTPVGTHFLFRAKEFDYFLAAQEIDPTVVRYAYLKAEGIADLLAKQLRLADITGRAQRRGEPPDRNDRRPAEEVARAYAADPSGAGARIQAWREAKATIVTEPTSRAARDPERREAVESGRIRNRSHRHSWRVEWEDETATAEKIVAKLLRDPELAWEVEKRLTAARVRTSRDQKRRSETTSSPNGRARTEKVSL
jgi:hypothetical protein